MTGPAPGGATWELVDIERLPPTQPENGIVQPGRHSRPAESRNTSHDVLLDPLAEEAPVEARTHTTSTERPADARDEHADRSELSAIRRSAAELTAVRTQLAERNLELRRLQDEYSSYRRRVERDRDRILHDALFDALAPVIDVLDSIDRAREHAPLDGGMQAVADQLERAASTKGLVRFGAPGDSFDPACHEAVQRAGSSDDVSVTTCLFVVRSGYRIDDRVLRPAQVVVVEPVSAD